MTQHQSDAGRFKGAAPMLEILAKLLVLVLLLAWSARHGGTKDNRAEHRRSLGRRRSRLFGLDG
jgi:hypothetical protein